MSITEIIAMSIGLAMDSCAVSMCTGISMKKFKLKQAIITSFIFGLFQALMPVLGYFLGNTFIDLIRKVNHIISFLIFLIIGLNMIIENKEEVNGDRLSLKNIILLAIATSIDAFVIGITFSFLNANIKVAITFIGIITFILSFLGVKVGNIFANKFMEKPKYKKLVSSIGGIILILLGVKELLKYFL